MMGGGFPPNCDAFLFMPLVFTFTFRGQPLAHVIEELGKTKMQHTQWVLAVLFICIDL